MINNKQRRTVLERDGYRCLWCREVFESGNLDVHHLVPTVIDGSDEDWNLATVCRHHHLLLNRATNFGATWWPEWWLPGEPTGEWDLPRLGRCFEAELARHDIELPEHVSDAISDAWLEPTRREFQLSSIATAFDTSV